MSSTGKQRDAESRDSASRVRADHLSDVRLSGGSVQVRSLQRRSQKKEFKFHLSCSIERECVFRTSKESGADGVSLSSDDAQRLFNVVKELLQIPSDEQDHQTADGDGYSLAHTS